MCIENGEEELEMVVGEGGLSRRSMLRMGVAAVAGTAVAAGAGVLDPLVAGADHLPDVWMERMVVQAQIECLGERPNFPGDAGVKRIQGALRAKGYGTTVDGYYGRGTGADYRAWQRRLGYSGIDANGLPGVTSLTRLGANRFDVKRKVNPGTRHWGSMTVGGRSQDPRGAVNERTRRMVNEARRKIGWDIVITKAGYLPWDDSSLGTHTGSALDIRTWNLTSDQKWRTVRALRAVGFAAWYRPWGGNEHIHAVPVGDPDLSNNPSHAGRSTYAAQQVAEYHRGGDGLAGTSPDNTPNWADPGFTWWESYLR